MSHAEGSLAVSVTSPGPVDEHCRARPAEPLRPYVAWYTGYRQRGVPPGRHRGLPSPFLTFIITLDEPLVMLAHPDPGQRPGTFNTLLGGLHSAPALIGHEGAQSGIQVALRPLGTRALLGLPAGELAEIDVPAEAVLSDLCAELRTRVLAATTWPRRFAVIFCRNVMIYFDADTQARAVEKLAANLEPGGYLFIGHAESLSRRPCSLEYIQPAVYRKPA